MESEEFYVRFWGVRGSLPCPGASYAGYGGNTPCIEIRCGDRTLVFDAGSGVRELGAHLAQTGCKDLDLYFTHCHYDHICGFPFFAPFFIPGTTVRLWSGHHLDDMTTESMVRRFMAPPFHPVGPEVFRADVSYHDFEPGDELTPGENIVIRTVELNHPNGCVGYRIEYAGKSICYISDTEHHDDKTDHRIGEVISNADIVIYDAAYTAAEYENCRGFGHSTWREGVKLCDLSGVGTLVAFHHCPGHEDGFMEALEERMNGVRPGSLVAREGMVLRP